MAQKKLPVLLLTGYLGSGKTTLLNRILANEQGLRFAVIVNDIGEVNIDARLIQQGGIVGQQDDGSLVPLQNGCICCTLKMDLAQQLRDLANADKFDYVVVEASGICEPAPIAQTISVIGQLIPDAANDKAVPYVDSIVTVVDALRMRDEFRCGLDLTKPNIGEDDIESLVIQQIEFCNIVLLNKASDVTPEELERTKQIVCALQPHAKIIPCDYGDVDLRLIVDTHMFDFDKVATSAAWIEAIEGEADEAENAEEGEKEEYNIGTYVYYRREPLRMADFDEFVARKWPKSVIRCKGLVYFNDEPDKCYLFEQAGRQISLRNAGMWYATMPADQLKQMLDKDAQLRRDWDPQWGDRMEKLVFIGQNLDPKEIDEKLDACLDTSL